MTTIDTTITTTDRPRERLQRHGSHVLSTADLLALLLRTGNSGQPVEQLAHDLLHGSGGLAALAQRTFEDLALLPGIGTTKAAVLIAAFELARRFGETTAVPTATIDSSQTLHARYAARLRHRAHEHLLVVALDRRHRVLRERWFTHELPTQAWVPTRALLLTALAANAAALVLLHNHPSGDPQPSAADVEVTQHVTALGRAVEIPLLDHLIVGDGCYYSFRDAGQLGPV